MTASSSMILRLRQVVQSKELKWAIGGWTFFIAENAILSENRTYLIAALGGDENYHLMYGTLSTAATASIGYAYYHLTRQNPTLVQYFKSSSHTSSAIRLPVANLLVSWTCLSIGLVLASQALPKMQIPVRLTSSSSTTTTTQNQSTSKDNDVIGPSPPQQQQGWKLSVQCPFDFSDKYKDNSSNNNNNMVVTGVDRVSRHVGLWSLGFLSAAQAALIIPSAAASASASASAAAAAAATLASTSALFAALWSLRLWWCGPMAVAWLGGMHSDSRFRRGMGGTLDPNVDCQTSNIPFLAMVTGKQGSPYNAFSNFWSELKPLNAVMATAVATVWIMSKGRASLFTTRAAAATSMVNTSKLTAVAFQVPK